MINERKAVDAKKNNFKKQWLILLAVIVIILAAAASKGSEVKYVSAYENLEDSEKQKEEISISKHKVIGEQVKIGELNFTVHGTKVSGGNEFRKPSEGNQFLYVDLTVENKGSKQTQMTSIMMFSLVGKDGKCYNIVLTEEKESINGLLESGDKMSGKVCFEVPENTQEFELEIKPSVVKAEKVIIDIKAGEVADIPDDKSISEGLIKSDLEKAEDSKKQKEEISISKHKAIGEQVKIGELNFTVHGTKVAEGNEFRKPSEGNQFLYVDLTVENKGSKQAQMTSIMLFSLVGKDGKCYNIVLPEEKESINGLLESGDKIRGKVCFEVPENTQEFELEIKPSVVKAEKVIIDIKAGEVADIPDDKS